MFRNEGFLSDDVQDLSAEIEKSCPGMWQLVLQVNSFSQGFQFRLNIKNTLPQLICATLLSRIIANFQGLLLLCKRGMPDQGFALLRVLLEGLFALAAISEDPEFVNQFVNNEEIERKKALLKLKEFRISNQRESSAINDITELISQIESTIKQENIKPFNAAELARKGKLSDLYNTVFAYSSFFVHSSPRSLESYLVADDSGSIVELRCGPDITGVLYPLECATEAIIIALSKTCKIFDLPEPIELGEFFVNLKNVDRSLFKFRGAGPGV